MVDMIINDFNPKLLDNFFSNKIRELCKYCKRYGKKSTCPPNIDSVEYYKKLLPTYKHGQLVIIETLIDNIENWKILGRKSSLEMYEKLITIRSELFSANRFATIYGAGSCKNCEKCQIPCAFPEKSIIPIEATGLNVTDAVKAISDIDVKFPVEKYCKFFRIGMVLYD